MSQPRGNLHPVAEDGLNRQAIRRRNQRAEILALDEFHDDVQLAVDIANFVNGADVRVAERGRSAGLMEQELLSLDAGGFADHLHRYVTLEHLVVSAIDHSHATLADLGEDSIVPQHLTDHRFAIGLWKASSRFLISLSIRRSRSETCCTTGLCSGVSSPSGPRPETRGAWMALSASGAR